MPLRTHRALADLVVASYGQTPTIDVGADVRCVVIDEPDETLVICPGTVSLAGWLRDFSAWPKSFGGLGYLHEGFGDGGLKLWLHLQTKINSAKPIAFTGHSLGAAVAQNLAGWAAFDGMRFRVVTWGTPRQCAAWNFAFPALIAKAFESADYRNPGDVVPDVPPLPFWKHTVSRTDLSGVAYLDPSEDHNMGLYASRTPAS